MKKLILMVAIATTISFAACTNANTTEQTEEPATETTEVNIEDVTVEGDTSIVVEMPADSIVVVVE